MGERIKSAYIAGPYTALTREEEDENIYIAAKAAAIYRRKGYRVFVPHLQSGYIDRHFNNDGYFEYEDWIEEDIYWLEKCDVVVFLPGWKSSTGASIEHMVAIGLMKEIHCLTEADLEVEM